MKKNKNVFIINDIIHEDVSKLQYVFILESPHKDEMNEGIPLCGLAGNVLLQF